MYSWAKDDQGKPKITVSKETAQSVRHEVTGIRGRVDVEKGKII